MADLGDCELSPPSLYLSFDMLIVLSTYSCSSLKQRQLIYYLIVCTNYQ